MRRANVLFRNVKIGAIGGGAFVLIIALIGAAFLRFSQHRDYGIAVSSLLKLLPIDLLFALAYAAVGATVGAVIGGILAVVDTFVRKADTDDDNTG